MNSVVLNLPAASGLVVNTGGCLVIHTTRETSGSAGAVYRLWDSNTNNGTLLLTVSLSSGESTRDFFPAHLLPFRTGLYFELVSGALEGAISVLSDHRCAEVLMAMLEHAYSDH